MNEPLHYTLEEIHSYLPSGWSLVDADASGGWDPRRQTWTVRVQDGADVERSLAIRAADAGERGRLEALRQAASRLHRRALR